MENLNDVEFGVDENQEEAPILIAQRHLNIFRQVHIFNKTKRDQFDDELLALPEVVINYIKKMPGGRLLIEHLEDVKTKRGISFVKSSSEDFISPDDTPSAPQPSAGGVPTQYVGGSLTMDANFADTFAKSMAEAFKQMPAPTINATGAPVASGDLGQFFEVIAEEIRTSRSSLLDVLKETKNITDSVIASQVSISRILEGILSSQTKGDSDTATMNNRIIASQASITKLLENLYTSNTKKNDEVSAYLDVDNKLQDFRNQLEQTINNSLTSIVNHIYDTTNKQATDIAVLDIEKKLATFKSELEADILKSLAKAPIAYPVANNSLPPQPIVKSDFVAPVSEQEEFDDTDMRDLSEPFIDNDTERKKKKKKKKKKNLEFTESAENILNSVAAPVVAAEAFNNTTSDIASDEKINGVIRNSQYKHEDTFDNINLDVPPADDFNLDEPQIDDLDLSVSAPAISDEIKTTDDTFVGKDYPIISETTASQHDFDSLDDLMGDNDGLDFVLPEQNTAIEEEEAPEVEDNAQPSRNLSSLDDLMNDGLDFELPQQSSVEETPAPIEENDVQSSDDLSSLDDLMSDGIDFNTPASEVTIAEETAPLEDTNVQSSEDFSSFDDLVGNNIDFSAPEQENIIEEEPSVEESNPQSSENLSSLDDLMDEDIVSTSTESENIDNNEVASDNITLSDASTFDNPVEDADEINNDDLTANEEDVEPSSRYSAELDKIRAALTGNNIDIASLDEPIALDDYDDDANVSEDDIPHNTYNQSAGIEESIDPQEEQELQSQPLEDKTDEDWEWEYVDENGNPVPNDENNTNDEDWEWEYVEDDSATEDNNKPE